MKRALLVWHNDSPGVSTWVLRGWLGRLFRNKHFASVGEKTYSYKPEVKVV